MSEKIVQRNEEDIKGASATGARQRCHSAILTGILPFLLRLPLGMNSPFVIRILCNKWGAVQCFLFGICCKKFCEFVSSSKEP